MAVIVIPNQPLKLIENGETFNERNARQMWDRRQFCQLVKTSQIQQFQLRVTENSGNNLIANGEFTSNLNGWQYTPPQFTWLAGRAVFNSALSPPLGAGILQNLSLEEKTYKLTFDIFWNGGGGELQEIQVAFSNATQIGGDSNIQSETGAGALLSTYTLYYRVTDSSSNFILFFFSSSASSAGNHRLDNVRLVELTEPVLSLQDCDGNYIKDINVVERFEDIITYTHSWAGLTDGQCYQFCLLGGDDLSLNYLEGSFCLLDGRNQPLMDENGNCVTYEIS